MPNPDPKGVETLFHAACARLTETERRAFLDGACGSDLDLRARVEALLSAHEAAGGFMEAPALESPREGPGSSIGPYKLLQEIGTGGMGVVYMAEQQEPVRRKVALKVIKLGMDTKQVIARFEAERQALALMDHEHIARVLDAGSTETGRPYFVMELVRGVPLNEYCNTHNLATRERLALFADVCRAVQHAHQKGVIHRDLKPTNVLVTSNDGKPMPKIIDFGVAKATHQRLTERTLFTEYRQIIGTPEYMSPEQAEMSGLDVDTRSDIYSLGVLLYELLTGTTPVDPSDLRTAAYDEMTRMIREDEPPVPSTRLTKLGVDAEKVARQHGSDVQTLAKHLRGDLDWIVMKALEKDRTRRYENASAFANDIARHLEDLPVEAGPPGARYRLQKFARRHRTAVLGALGLSAVIALGLVGTVSGFVKARSEADRSGRMSASLESVLALSDPGSASERGEVEQVLETVRAVFGEGHATYAAVLDTLAERLEDAGDFEAAEALSRDALAIWTTVSGAEHPNVARTLGRLGSVLRAQGKDDDAESILRRSLEVVAASASAGHLSGLDARLELADLVAARGDYDEADSLYGEALAILRASPNPATYKLLDLLERRYLVQTNNLDLKPTETLSDIYELTHRLYPDESPVLAISALGYGRHLMQQGELEAALPYLREAVERFRSNPNSPKAYVLGASDSLFMVLRTREDPESLLEGDALMRDLIRVGRDLLGTDQLAENMAFHANRMVQRGRLDEALRSILDAHRTFVDGGRSVGAREPIRDRMTMMAFRAVLGPDQDEATYALAAEAMEMCLDEEPGKAAMLVVRGAARLRLGDIDGAVADLEHSPSLRGISGGLAQGIFPADHAYRALAYAAQGRLDEARDQAATLRGAFDRAGGNPIQGKDPDHPGLSLLAEVEAAIAALASGQDG